MRVMITGGGTGGHIYPGLALARYALAKDSDNEILFVGSERGLENEIVPSAGIPFITIPARGFQRNLSQLVPLIKDLGNGLKQAGRTIENFKPNVVLGTGGYASAPLVMAAVFKRLPVILHEQNALPGMLNRYMAPFVDRVCISFAGTEKNYFRFSKTVFTGNPRASEVIAVSREEACRFFGLDPDRVNIIIFGGSRGALTINRVVTAYLKDELLPEQAGLIYITGTSYYRDILAELGCVANNIKIFPYLDNMPQALAASDLAVSRSGATTLAEFTALGLPALLIPSPNVVGNHQYFNARYLVDAGAALLLEEKDFTKGSLQDYLDRLVEDPLSLRAMSECSRKMAVLDAAERLYSCLEEVAS